MERSSCPFRPSAAAAERFQLCGPAFVQIICRLNPFIRLTSPSIDSALQLMDPNGPYPSSVFVKIAA